MCLIPCRRKPLFSQTYLIFQRASGTFIDFLSSEVLNLRLSCKEMNPETFDFEQFYEMD